MINYSIFAHEVIGHSELCNLCSPNVPRKPIQFWLFCLDFFKNWLYLPLWYNSYLIIYMYCHSTRGWICAICIPIVPRDTIYAKIFHTKFSSNAISGSGEKVKNFTVTFGKSNFLILLLVLVHLGPEGMMMYYTTLQYTYYAPFWHRRIQRTWRHIWLEWGG